MDEKDFENAAQLEMLQRDVAIQAARQALHRKVRPDDFDGTCPSCSAEIDERRIAAGYFECVDCVAEQEQLRRLLHS